MRKNKIFRGRPFRRRSKSNQKKEEIENNRTLIPSSQPDTNPKKIGKNAKLKKGLKIAGIVVLVLFTLAYFASPEKAELNSKISEQQATIVSS